MVNESPTRMLRFLETAIALDRMVGALFVTSTVIVSVWVVCLSLSVNLIANVNSLYCCESNVVRLLTLIVSALLIGTD